MAKRIVHKKSRLQDDKSCWWCGRTEEYVQLDHHEFLNGSDRTHAIEDGLWVWACRECHERYQNDASSMLMGRKLSQKVYEVEIDDRATFMKRYRKNYL